MPDNGGYYYFVISLPGWGRNPEEAWENAQQTFAWDPGPVPKDYDFLPDTNCGELNYGREETV